MLLFQSCSELFQRPWKSDVTSYSTVWERINALTELHVENLSVQWSRLVEADQPHESVSVESVGE